MAPEKKPVLAPCMLTQPVLAALLQGRAESGSQEGGALGERLLGMDRQKGQHAAQQWGLRRKKCEKQLCKG